MCKTGKTGESSIIRVGSQYVTNVSVKGKVDKKSEDLWLPASRYLAFSFLLPRREETVYELETLPSPSVAKPAPLQFRPRTGVPAKTLAVLTRFTLGDSWHSSWTWIPTPWKLFRIPESNLIFNRMGLKTREIYPRLHFRLQIVFRSIGNKIEHLTNKACRVEKKNHAIRKIHRRETIASRPREGITLRALYTY